MSLSSVPSDLSVLRFLPVLCLPRSYLRSARSDSLPYATGYATLPTNMNPKSLIKKYLRTLPASRGADLILCRALGNAEHLVQRGDTVDHLLNSVLV